MKTTLEIVGNNIFWRSFDMSSKFCFEDFHKDLVGKLKKYKNAPLLQIQNKNLTLEQEKLVKEYGVYWGIPGYFDPHITVVYELSLTEEKREKVKRFLKMLEVKNYILKPTKLILARIEYYGNLEEVL
ncbi:MAG TPA: hypothetical protein VI959_00725 [Alphaproteobacteria bacterium]|nr:hypothetical protein [Alphaproteobacteria bacterium]